MKEGESVQIAICNQDISTVQAITDYIDYWIQSNSYVDVTYRTFSSAKQLLFSIESEMEFDLFILAGSLPDMDGVDLARRIRDEDETAVIVFSSLSENSMAAAFEVKAFQCLQKPFEYEAIKNCLECAYSDSRLKGKYILIKSDGIVKKILLKDITYFDAGVHTISVHTARNEEYHFSYKHSMQQFFETKCGRTFVRCHRGYIVNLQYVDGYNTNTLFLLNNTLEIPIGRSFHKETIEKLGLLFRQN